MTLIPFRIRPSRGCGDKPSGKAIALHLARVIETLPKTVETPWARTDAVFHCWEAVKVCMKSQCEFLIVARKIDRKTGRLLGEGRPRRDGVPPHTDADLACQFRHQPERWEREYRFVGLRYDQPEPDAADLDQIGLFNGLACLCRLCLT